MTPSVDRFVFLAGAGGQIVIVRVIVPNKVVLVSWQSMEKSLFEEKLKRHRMLLPYHGPSLSLSLLVGTSGVNSCELLSIWNAAVALLLLVLSVVVQLVNL